MLHLSLLKRFPLFIWLLFAVSSVSNFRPDTGGRRWSLVQLCLVSRAAGREGHCRQISVACVGSTHSVLATRVCPAHGCVLSPSTHLRLPAALYGAGPALRVVPVFGYFTKARTQLPLRFVPSPARAAQAASSLTGALSPGAVRLLPTARPSLSFRTCASRVSAPCSQELASSGDPPVRCRPSKIS